MGVPNDRSHVRTSLDAVIILGMFSNVNKKETSQLTDANLPSVTPKNGSAIVSNNTIS